MRRFWVLCLRHYSSYYFYLVIYYRKQINYPRKKPLRNCHYRKQINYPLKKPVRKLLLDYSETFINWFFFLFFSFVDQFQLLVPNYFSLRLPDQSDEREGSVRGLHGRGTRQDILRHLRGRVQAPSLPDPHCPQGLKSKCLINIDGKPTCLQIPDDMCVTNSIEMAVMLVIIVISSGVYDIVH